MPAARSSHCYVKLLGSMKQLSLVKHSSISNSTPAHQAWLDSVLLTISQAGQLQVVLLDMLATAEGLQQCSGCCTDAAVQRAKQKGRSNAAAAAQTLQCKRPSRKAAAMRRPLHRRCSAGRVPHDLDSDGTQVAGIKSLLEGTHLIQDTPNGPYICLAIICLALHSCQTYSQRQCLHSILCHLHVH